MPEPSTTFLLELTKKELDHLWMFLTMRTLKTWRPGEQEETSILEKVTRLMEGR